MKTRRRALSALEARRQHRQKLFLEGLKPYGAWDEIKRHELQILELNETLQHDPILLAIQKRHHARMIIKIAREMVSRAPEDLQARFQEKLQNAVLLERECEDLIGG